MTGSRCLTAFNASPVFQLVQHVSPNVFSNSGKKNKSSKWEFSSECKIANDNILARHLELFDNLLFLTCFRCILRYAKAETAVIYCVSRWPVTQRSYVVLKLSIMYDARTHCKNCSGKCPTKYGETALLL